MVSRTRAQASRSAIQRRGCRHKLYIYWFLRRLRWPRRRGFPAGQVVRGARDLNLIEINQIAITGVSGEIFTKIYWHLKKASPLSILA